MKANDVIIYSDMDGTLLTDWSMGPVVPEPNLRLIRELVERGGSFSVATGRQAPDALGFFPGVPLAPLVCANGAVVYDPEAGQMLRKILLPQPYKRECADYFLARPDLWIVAADHREIVQVSSGDPAQDSLLNDMHRRLITVEEFLTGEYVKVVYVLPEGGDMEGLKAEVAQLPSAGLVTGAQSGPWYLEMVERSVNKAEGIRYARRAAGLEGRTLVCIGDYFNDWTMLQSADLAACPGDSHREIQDICQIVTCGHNEGAVADLIQRLRLW